MEPKMTNQDIELDRLKAVELEILKEFINSCEKLKLRYFLMDGTMLGAVRHNGFIPWDDDIDVGMYRKDYEVFIHEAQRLLPDHYFLQTYETDPGSLINFAKIRDNRTTFIEVSRKNIKMNHGVYIDIFPLDFFPEDIKIQNTIENRIRIASLRIRKELNLPKNNRGSVLSETVKFLAGSVFQIKYPKPIMAVRAKDSLYKTCSESNLIINYCGAYGRKAVVPREWYGNGRRVIFEGIETFIPEKAELYLAQVYGDYLSLPPKEKRVSHHYCTVIDTEKSFLYYTKRFR